MIKRFLVPSVAATLIAGCQSSGTVHEPGWAGAGATPFDEARAACMNAADHDETSEQFLQCMKEKGWSRK